MKIKTWYIWLSILALLVMALEEIPDKNFRIVTCDVGQGDAILLTQGFTQVLVDGGPTEAVMSCLERYIPWFDRKLEMVVSTHPQDDHLAGLVQVLSRYKVTWLMANGVVNQARSFWDFRQEVLDNQIQVHAPSAGRNCRRPDAFFGAVACGAIRRPGYLARLYQTRSGSSVRSI